MSKKSPSEIIRTHELEIDNLAVNLDDITERCIHEVLENLVQAASLCLQSYGHISESRTLMRSLGKLEALTTPQSNETYVPPHHRV